MNFWIELLLALSTGAILLLLVFLFALCLYKHTWSGMGVADPESWLAHGFTRRTAHRWLRRASPATRQVPPYVAARWVAAGYRRSTRVPALGQYLFSHAPQVATREVLRVWRTIRDRRRLPRSGPYWLVFGFAACPITITRWGAAFGYPCVKHEPTSLCSECAHTAYTLGTPTEAVALHEAGQDSHGEAAAMVRNGIPADRALLYSCARLDTPEALDFERRRAAGEDIDPGLSVLAGLHSSPVTTS